MAKAKLVALHAAQVRARKQKGKTLVAVFTEKKVKKVQKAQKPMMTSKNIIKEPEKPSEPQPKSNYPGPRIEDPQPGPLPAVKGESKNERILRILRNSAKRLQSQGMPELDVELNELIKEVEGWGA